MPGSQRGRPRFTEQHLTTLFPPVRPRGTYLEVRYLDAQPLDRIEQVVEVLATLAYDETSVPGRSASSSRRRTCWVTLAGCGGRLADPRGGGGMNVLFVTDPLAGCSPTSTRPSG